MYSENPRLGGFSLPGQTQTAGTVIAQFIPPFRGPVGESPFMYTVDGTGKPNWYNQPVTYVQAVSVLTGSTAHLQYFLRPLNWTYLAEAMTANDTTAVLTANPGTFSANYKYPHPTGIPTRAADNSPASGDYLAIQMDDGSWLAGTISGLSTLTVTFNTGTPNLTGATAAVGRPVFFFGVGTDADPATGHLHFNLSLSVSVTHNIMAPDGICRAMHGGDPMMYVNANATAADTLGFISGFYGKF